MCRVTISCTLDIYVLHAGHICPIILHISNTQTYFVYIFNRIYPSFDWFFNAIPIRVYAGEFTSIVSEVNTTLPDASIATIICSESVASRRCVSSRIFQSARVVMAVFESDRCFRCKFIANCKVALHPGGRKRKYEWAYPNWGWIGRGIVNTEYIFFVRKFFL